MSVGFGVNKTSSVIKMKKARRLKKRTPGESKKFGAVGLRLATRHDKARPPWMTIQSGSVFG